MKLKPITQAQNQKAIRIYLAGAGIFALGGIYTGRWFSYAVSAILISLVLIRKYLLTPRLKA